MMPRYIDADKLNIKKATMWFDDPNDRRSVERMIREAPTVDAVPVVRCKNCAYRDEEPCDNNLLWCNRISNAVLPFGYCSDGIRRLDNG